MSTSRGALLAIEGVDGAGKHTQAVALSSALQRLGFATSLYTFPDYSGSRLGSTLRHMLAGNFGNATSIHPMLSAPLFALERAEKKDKILSDLNSGVIVICDRYVYSNVAHQACRLPMEERANFCELLEYIEFNVLGLPRATATILLDIDDSASEERRRERAEKSNFNRPLDDYERDSDSLSSARSIYLELARRLQWTICPAFIDGEQVDRMKVTESLLKMVKPILGGI